MNQEEDLFKKYNMADSIKRLIAYKVNIETLAKGKYVINEGWQPNYILTEAGQKISRVNLIATVVTVQNEENDTSIIIDDGTTTIRLRSFDKDISLPELGTIINIIGRPREFGGEKYIAPEIIKVINNPIWVDLRKMELNTINKAAIPARINNTKNTQQNLTQKVFELIRKLDSGVGVDIDDIVKKTKNSKTEEIINNLLKEGEIFEIKRGRIKVLE